MTRISRSSPAATVCGSCVLQRRAQFGRHRLERSEQRFAGAVLAHHFDALHEVADRAFERDHRIARRKVGEALAHCRDLGPHGAEIDSRAGRIALLAPEVVKREREGANVVAQRFRQRRCEGGFRDGGRRVELGRCRRGLRARARVWAGRGRGDANANAELLAAHGDLRHGGLEIARRLRRRPLAGLSWAAPAGVDRFQPPDRIDQRLPVGVARRIRALNNLGDRFERARRPRFGA